MKQWRLLLGVSLLVGILWFAFLREHFADSSQPVTRPCACPTSGQCTNSACKSWDSKVSAQAPSGAVNADYITVLAAFYDTVYSPAQTKPTEAQVDTFLASPAGTVSGVQLTAVKRMIMDGFDIDYLKTASQRDTESVRFTPSVTNLEPKLARDQVRSRVEVSYTPADPVLSTKFSEGNYEKVTQSEPINPGQWEDGTSLWKGPRPASVPPSAENVM